MTDSESDEAKPSTEIRADDFSGLVAGMSKLISGLAHIQPFSDAQFGLAEWVALSTLVVKGDLNGKALANNLGVSSQNNLGVSPQRVNQISSTLAAAGLIAEKEPDAEGRSGKIGITETGRKQVQAVNVQLEALLSAALKGKESSISRASKQMTVLMRVVRMGTPGAETRKTKKEKNAGVKEPAAVEK